MPIKKILTPSQVATIALKFINVVYFAIVHLQIVKISFTSCYEMCWVYFKNSHTHITIQYDRSIKTSKSEYPKNTQSVQVTESSTESNIQHKKGGNKLWLQAPYNITQPSMLGSQSHGLGWKPENIVPFYTPNSCIRSHRDGEPFNNFVPKSLSNQTLLQDIFKHQL